MADFPNLYEWVGTVEPGDFPPAPYQLTPWMKINTWEKHLKAIAKEGPDSPRAMNGALQEHLRRLYKLWNSGRTS
jgi:hypothetical protein